MDNYLYIIFIGSWWCRILLGYLCQQSYSLKGALVSFVFVFITGFFFFFLSQAWLLVIILKNCWIEGWAKMDKILAVFLILLILTICGMIFNAVECYLINRPATPHYCCKTVFQRNYSLPNHAKLRYSKSKIPFKKAERYGAGQGTLE